MTMLQTFSHPALRIAFTSCVAALLAGCSMNVAEGLLGSTYSADTSGKKIGLFGGVKSTQIGPYTYQIEAKGNAYTKDRSTYRFSVLRAAQLALENGHTHFTINKAANTGFAPSRTTAGYAGGYVTGPVGASRSDGSFQQGQRYIGGSPGRTVYGQYRPGYGLIAEMWNSANIAEERRNGSKAKFYNAETTYREFSPLVRGTPQPLHQLHGTYLATLEDRWRQVSPRGIDDAINFSQRASRVWRQQREDLLQYYDKDSPELAAGVAQVRRMFEEQYLPLVNAYRAQNGWKALSYGELVMKYDWKTQ